MRSGVKQSVLSVSQSVSRLSVRQKKLKSPHIDLINHRNGVKQQQIAKHLLYVYLTEVKAFCFYFTDIMAIVSAVFPAISYYS